ncbi:GDSL-type esterase/lipase family protein [Mesorhizobium ventifaucium]|uniref:SGNH_hydro domain-containing protein n=1 Tax=Mesorhizobium ventifaucium TaxID=666020 RepID=A0ABN8JCB8_9HYPH|nr:GDSL-type esterase/lipase family protein [Mesorhizobium ventifaucium]CAH2395756.1 SGNH_hydro domain-containing protein [Mesorhizobium ventifaucium]
MKKMLIFSTVLAMLLVTLFATRSDNAHWQAKVDEFRQFKGHADIVMFGDSLTASGHWQEMFPRLSIINRGISGERVDSALLRLDQITAAEPRLVFIMLGVNDISRSASPDDVATSYGKIIERLANVDSIVVQSTLFTSSEVHNAAIKRLNSALMALCSNAANCRFLDLNASLSRNDSLRPEFTTDGVHLNGDGYRVWENQIRPIMAAS